MFKLVKRFYDKKIYSKEDVKIFVKSEDITPEQYKEITGDEYTI